MGKFVILWDNPIHCYRQIKKNYAGCGNIRNPYPYRTDCKNLITKFEAKDFPITQFSTTAELKEWLTEHLAGTDGIYYLRTQCTLINLRKRKFKRTIYGIKIRKGRPLYSRDKLKALRIFNKPRQRTQTVWNTVLKFEMWNGVCTRIWERKGRRKRSPYNKPRYEVIRQIERNRKHSALPI